jgi:hypothetical protein
MLPPIWRPKGIAPYRAGLYAQLAAGALRTGHPYWGYRFLAWSIHYIQDVTQPWHTIFLPGPLFLQLTKSGMKHEISSLHYLTEAFVDSWMLQAMPRPVPVVYHEYVKQTDDPWFVCRLTEDFASQAHARAEEAAELSRTLFSPVERALDANYKPRSPSLRYGGITFATRSLDFATDGAAKFLQPIWSPEFALASTRDRYLRLLAGQIDAAVEGSRDIVAYVLSGLKASRVGGEHL